ncbi:MAG: tripartite tricarboxylate transporter substrate binding protein [Syntrophales bacterium LBB04]|nr:tripartite tricarboxylate transporter substrate binding protein [Syntrophales bacterium LBB04]
MATQKGFEKGRRDFLRLLGIGGSAVFLNGVQLPKALAKDIFPSQKIQWIVYSKPGGGFDLIARTIAPYLGKYLKEASKAAQGGDTIIRNITEAGGQRAYSTIYNAKPDGYTLGDLNTGSYCETMFTKSDIDYRKFTFIVRNGVSSRIVVTNKNGFKSWEEMMKAGKEKEVKWACGNFGAGAHISAILAKEFMKVPARLINFPGTAENANAILRGDVQMGLATDESAKALIDAGELRVLTVFADKSSYPGVPSLAQLGFPDLAEAALLHRMIIGPPNIPREITNSLTSAFKKLLSDAKFLAQAKKIGFDPDPLYGADAERMVKKIFKYYDDNAPILKKYLT